MARRVDKPHGGVLELQVLELGTTEHVAFSRQQTDEQHLRFVIERQQGIDAPRSQVSKRWAWWASTSAIIARKLRQ